MKATPLLALTFLPLLLTAAEPQADPGKEAGEKQVEARAQDDAQGPAFKKLLTDTIRSAEQITITEVSYYNDFLKPGGAIQEKFPDYEYGSARLTGAQKNDLLLAMEAMDATTAPASRCFFPHHRIDMTTGEGKKSTLLVCFQCDSVQWSDGGAQPIPRGLFPVLRATLKSVGLEEERDWKKLAQERLAKESQETSSKQPAPPEQEMTPEEVLEKMGKLDQKVMEDETNTIRESAEYRKLSEALPGVLRTLLCRRIREADHITITEISSYGDFIPLVYTVAKVTDLPKYEYASKRVTPEQQALAAKTAETMDLSYPEPNYCGPTPHHRMDITGKDGKVSTLLICYECLNVYWEEFPSLSETNGIWSVLNPMMKQAGLETEKDWGKMAMDRYAEETAKNKSPHKQAPAK